MNGYADADWGSCEAAGRRSCTGYPFKFRRGGAVTWASKLQNYPALSSTNAEKQDSEDEFQKDGFQIYVYPLPTGGIMVPIKPTRLLLDNNGAIALARNPESHKRSKHIDIRRHFIRSYVECRDLETQYIPTEEMTADILTKPLGKNKHWHHVRMLGMLSEEDFQNGK
jgi:hypothetical protein